MSFRRHSLFALLLFVAACHSGEAAEEATAPAEEPEEHSNSVAVTQEAAEAAGVKIETAGPQRIKISTAIPGEVLLNEDRTEHIRPRFPGIVKKVEKKLGDSVLPNDLLALVQSNESLSLYEIRSETSGEVIARNVSPGGLVKDDQEIFTIADLKTVWVSAAVYPDSVSRLRAGMSAEVKSSDGNQTQTSSVGYVSPVVNKTSRTQELRLMLDNDPRRWLPGMFVTVSVVLDERDAECVVPVDAVIIVDDRPVVFVPEKGDEDKETFTAREVKLGGSDSKFTEILEGIEPGEKVAVNPFILKAELQKTAPGD